MSMPLKAIQFIFLIILLCGLLGCAPGADSNRDEDRNGLTPAVVTSMPVTLRFESLSDDLKVDPAPAEPGELSNVHTAYPLGGGELVLYGNGTDDADGLNGGLSIGYRSSAGEFTIGPIAYGGYEPTITESSLSGDMRMLRVEGICGANCPDTYYIAAKEGVPSVVLHIQAHIAEADPDGDGAVELLASSGTAIQTSVIEFDQGGVPQVADVAAALAATSVAFDPDNGLFAAYTADTAETAHYRYDGIRLHRVPPG